MILKILIPYSKRITKEIRDIVERSNPTYITSRVIIIKTDKKDFFSIKAFEKLGKLQILDVDE